MTKPVGVYIHIPFCRKRCAYCDFYSAVINDSVIEAYVKRLKEEIYRWGDSIGRPADTVYFGGGTPSVLSADVLCSLLNDAKSAFKVKDGCEITVEINPENADFEYLSALKKGGFNRLSIGIQSLDDSVLKTLGRRHSAKEGIDAFKTARKAGFDNISVDLMLSLPGQSIEKSLKNAQEIIELSPEHISCYMLILEEKTALYKLRESLDFKSEEQYCEEYLSISRKFKEAGYSKYEISNFSKKGKESKHNLKYWHTEEYIGIGPSAYSFIDGKRFHFEGNMHSFLKGSEPVCDGEGGEMSEYIMLALRLNEGISEEKIKEKYFKRFSNRFIKKAEQLMNDGLAFFEDDIFSLTEEGMLLSNSIICEMTEEDLYENI